MRSLLFVPADSRRKFEKASMSKADALILDLEDSVAPAMKAEARELLGSLLAAPRRQKLFVRVNALETGLVPLDLAAVMPGRPDGIVLPKCSGPDAVRQLGHYLDVGEACEDASGAQVGSTRILAIVTETAESVRALAACSYANVSPRLWGMMWGGEDLTASLGASPNNGGDSYREPIRLARNLCLIAAAAAGVEAIDAVAPDIDNLHAIAVEAQEARRDGFSGKAVIHPTHVEPVHTAFTPAPEEVAWALRVREAFARQPDAGVLRLDGKMVDKPHLGAAERILGRTNWPASAGTRSTLP
ncbi:CoA ester lyase [Azorhizobium caulinodans]|uniref:HpcH/HpaI aldolase/citrate lyase family protein n=1 Tax=Azorhizobium caulinodans TaxID=7 RepID=UPI002FBE68BA